jgi:hypothetical protein
MVPGIQNPSPIINPRMNKRPGASGLACGAWYVGGKGCGRGDGACRGGVGRFAALARSWRLSMGGSISGGRGGDSAGWAWFKRERSEFLERRGKSARDVSWNLYQAARRLARETLPRGGTLKASNGGKWFKVDGVKWWNGSVCLARRTSDGRWFEPDEVTAFDPVADPPWAPRIWACRTWKGKILEIGG